MGECEKSIKWAEEIVTENLKKRMFKGEDGGAVEKKIKGIKNELADHAVNLSHNRHISAERCKEIGLKIEMLEDNQELQDAALSVHHCYMHTLSHTSVFKIIENHEGVTSVQAMRSMA